MIFPWYPLIEFVAELPDVVHVIPNHLYKLHTTRSWDYLGLSTFSPPTNLLHEANMGDGVIIGVLDIGFPIILFVWVKWKNNLLINAFIEAGILLEGILLQS